MGAMGLSNPCTPASVAPLVSLADALTQRGHEARLIAAASFVAVRTSRGPDLFERIYLCGGRFRWAGTHAGDQDIASRDDIARAADTIAGVLGGDSGTHGVAASAGTVNSRVYLRGGRAAEPGTP